MVYIIIFHDCHPVYNVDKNIIIVFVSLNRLNINLNIPKTLNKYVANVQNSKFPFNNFN